MSSLYGVDSSQDYIDQKLEILRELMDELDSLDEDAVKSYIVRNITATDEARREIQIDNLVRKVLMDYYEGDRTFVQINEKCKTYYEKLKKGVAKYKIIYENLVIKYVGKKGMRTLLNSNLISPYKAANGLVAYKIADSFR